jgi:SAM-dependent methyltransferase
MDAAIWKDTEVASAYLNERSLVIPDREKQLEIMLRVIRYAPAMPGRVLDLGCGEGILLAAVLEAYPYAKGIALDFSPRMLDQARLQLARFGLRAQTAEADLNSTRWREVVTGPFDVVVSGLAIHHLPHPRKQELYQEIFDLLAEGGVFLNTEHVASPTTLVEGISNDNMAEHLLARRLRDGDNVTFEEVRTAFLERPDRAANILAPVEDQCEWLRKIGFQHVDCYWKCLEIAVLGGMKISCSN